MKTSKLLIKRSFFNKIDDVLCFDISNKSNWDGRLNVVSFHIKFLPQ